MDSRSQVRLRKNAGCVDKDSGVNKSERDSHALITFDELPEFLKDNQFIINYYRPPMGYKDCFLSLGWLHNETGNIYSHLIPASILVGIIVCFLTPLYSGDNFLDGYLEKAIHCVFFLGALACLSFSTVFHIVHIKDGETFCCFSRIDYSGISLMMLGKMVPWVYYMFYCQRFYRFFYIGGTVVFNLTIVFMILWCRQTSDPKYRTLRPLAFAGMALYALFPIIHAAMEHGVVNLMIRGNFWSIVVMFLCYIVGSFIYVMRMPERWAPGKFDMWFHSHQIFHVCVVAATIFYYYCIVNLQKSRMKFGADSCDVF